MVGKLSSCHTGIGSVVSEHFNECWVREHAHGIGTDSDIIPIIYDAELDLNICDIVTAIGGLWTVISSNSTVKSRLTKILLQILHIQCKSSMWNWVLNIGLSLFVRQKLKQHKDDMVHKRHSSLKCKVRNTFWILKGSKTVQKPGQLWAL